ncbi:TransThyretin family domain [Trichostrongylus colubriformis]|uniref:TransThyretin family domain n=1 Tax=Trichostrongylus colubriformis TaxID=6319 RepID=A0AAN8GD85_TRICO
MLRPIHSVELRHMNPTSILIFALLPVCDGLFGFGRLQSATVVGTLRCYGVPASKVKVVLFDRELFLPDTYLDRGETDRNGEFYLFGEKREFTNIEPYVKIYHKCNYNGSGFDEREIDIADKCITKGRNSTFYLGIVNLEEK